MKDIQKDDEQQRIFSCMKKEAHSSKSISPLQIPCLAPACPFQYWHNKTHE